MIELDSRVEALLDECRLVRRELHRIPETAYTETKTQRFVLEYLKALQPDKIEEIAGTGVKAVFYAPAASETIAFRADMDALPVTEETGAEYRSEHDGCMHACGHDGHMSALLMLARLVASERSSLKHNVVLLFQPAEEGAGGAIVMIEQGALKNPDVNRIYGLHVWPELPVGVIGTRPGPLMAQSCGLDITVKGSSSHAATPDKGADAIVAGAHFITMLQSIVSRNMPPDETVVISMGQFHGGEVRNVVCDQVVINGTFRTYSDFVHDEVIQRMRNMADGIERAMNVSIDIEESQRYLHVDNDEKLYKDVSLMLGNDCILQQRSMLGEDFAFYQREAPGLFFFLGVGAGENAKLHNSRFNFDERALLYGVEIYRRILEL